MADLRDRDADIEQLLVDFESAAKTPPRERDIKISNSVERLCSSAYENGLSSKHLSRLVDIITLPNELDQASIGSLVRNLYPRSQVHDPVIFRIVGSLGHGRDKPSYTAQAAMLKWIILVYDILEDRKVLSQLYAVLFNLLDTVALRAPLCHMLSLTTRRKHVRPFRIQILMELMRQAGNEPSLIGLMRVYKDYYPDVILGDIVSGKAIVFTHPNYEWRRRLHEIQKSHRQSISGRTASENRIFRTNRQSIAWKRRTRSSTVPDLHTSHAHESSVTLEEIENIDDFVAKIEKIEPPNQLVAVLGDSLLQLFLQLRSSRSFSQRVDSWLMAFFEDQLQNTAQSESNIFEMLEAIQGYAYFMKEVPPACLIYLKSMIHSWNGITNREIVLDLLSFLPCGSFEALYEDVLRTLEDAILDDGTIISKLALLGFYKNLHDRWMVDLLSRPLSDVNAAQHITGLVDHASTLSLTIIQTSLSVTTISTVLDFYESIAAAISIQPLKSAVRIAIPPAELIYTLQFTDSLSSVSRLCAILALYKRAFEIAMTSKALNSPAYDQRLYHKDYVNHFNAFLMDICNCLWRSRALNNTDPNAKGSLVDSSVTATMTKYIASLGTSGLELSSLFSLSFSPVFCLIAITYIREAEDAAVEDIERRHAGPVTQNSLKQLEKDGGLRLAWPEYRLGILQYMERKGAPGVGELMYNTMKHLLTSRKDRT